MDRRDIGTREEVEALSAVWSAISATRQIGEFREG
jgi:hypothetical protein